MLLPTPERGDLLAGFAYSNLKGYGGGDVRRIATACWIHLAWQGTSGGRGGAGAPLSLSPELMKRSASRDAPAFGRQLGSIALPGPFPAFHSTAQATRTNGRPPRNARGNELPDGDIGHECSRVQLTSC